MEIWELKDKLVKHMAKEFEERERVDSELADAIKDLAEADYYCSVVDAMEDGRSGYPMEYGMGYEPMGYGMRRGYNSNRSARTGRYTRGYMGYEDTMAEAKRLIGEMTAEERKALKETL